MARPRRAASPDTEAFSGSLRAAPRRCFIISARTTAITPIIADGAGNLYGTTCSGGADDEGTVFELAPGGRETILYSFGGKSGDGNCPAAGLTRDKAGNLYGTTETGGTTGCRRYAGCGTVFRLAPDGSETVVYAFRGRSHGDGAYPEAGLIGDANGNLYGTTKDGGEHFDGTVFRLAPDGSETVLHTFAGGTNGAYPVAGLIEDGRGNLYGTTKGGGGTSCQEGCGTVFVITAKGE